MLNNFFISAAALCLLLTGPQQSPVPVFRGSTEVVVVDVQITDRSGEPIAGLTADDFTLKVDGKPRAIASANFWKLGDRPAVVKADNFSTLGGLNDVSAESYVLFVVDPANMRPEPARILFDQATEFMTQLDPAHSVGLLVVPEPRLRIPFGALRQPVAKAMKGLGGYRTKDPSTAEAYATMGGLTKGIDALSAVDGRRTLVYFGDSFPEDRNLIEQITLPANLSDISIYAVASDSLVIPSVTDRHAPANPLPPGGEYGGLGLMADSTGGRVFRRAVTGAIVLPRLARALSAHYVLTFNVEAPDKNGKTHKIDVKVNRENVYVGFRREFAR